RDPAVAGHEQPFQPPRELREQPPSRQLLEQGREGMARAPASPGANEVPRIEVLRPLDRDRHEPPAPVPSQHPGERPAAEAAVLVVVEARALGQRARSRTSVSSPAPGGSGVLRRAGCWSEAWTTSSSEDRSTPSSDSRVTSD